MRVSPSSGGPFGAQGPSLRERFWTVLAGVAQRAGAGEILAGWLRAERSDFVRFNRARVRQAGSVERATLELRLILEERQARHTLALCGDPDEDRQRVDVGVERLRAAVAAARPDPFLSFSDRPGRSEHLAGARMASIDELVDTVGESARGADLVGFHAAGPVACAMVSSLGHDHWHETATWSFDWSVFAAGSDRALKADASGSDWSGDVLRAAITRSIRDAAILARPAHRLSPGSYRCLLAPRAVADLIEMLRWGGFSARAHASGQSPLLRLRAGDAAFDARVSIAEDLGIAGAPRFQSDGFERPGRLDLVRAGRYGESLVSPRSACEFALIANGATASETPEALTMAAGDLDERDACARLGTGIAAGNLWYLNFSDPDNCRITGMTRFATLWVEGGEPVAPIEPMRFDDSLYRVLGDSLEALGAEVRRMPDTSTYDGRGFGATSAPAALVDGLRFTL